MVTAIRYPQFHVLPLLLHVVSSIFSRTDLSSGIYTRTCTQFSLRCPLCIRVLSDTHTAHQIHIPAHVSLPPTNLTPTLNPLFSLSLSRCPSVSLRPYISVSISIYLYLSPFSYLFLHQLTHAIFSDAIERAQALTLRGIVAAESVTVVTTVASTVHLSGESDSANATAVEPFILSAAAEAD